ncbi:hypothetical protein GQ53DRAFT_837513 [Thozetella sp. PMI_491]|nr:hypothetical protein GQ53DRAFT_837513 [Thozetella sp. PMI_491]
MDTITNKASGSHVLLIGIDAYPPTKVHPLTSCVRDVREISKCLRQTKAAVKVLAAGNTSTSSDDLPEERPTFDNVVESIRLIAKAAAPGDSVFIHFSGHGTVLPPEENLKVFSNENIGDLALVLLKRDEDDVYPLRGLKLAHLLKEMVCNSVHVTLVLDCCFSGAVLRRRGQERSDHAVDDNQSARYISWMSGFGPDYSPKEVDAIMPGNEYRDATTHGSWLLNPDGYIIIAACQPHQIALEHKDELGQSFGRLSYFLLEALREPNFGSFPNVSWGQIFSYIRGRFKTEHPQQTPAWYGNNSRLLESDDGVLGTRMTTPFIAYHQKNQTFRVECGKVHGVHNDDEFVLFLVGKPDEVQVKAKVSVLRPLTCDLVAASPGLMVESSRISIAARAYSRFSLRKFPILLGLDSLDGTEWPEIQLTRPWLRFIDNKACTRASFKVTLSTSGDGYSIEPVCAGSFQALPISLSTQKTIQALEQLAEYQLWKELSCPLAPDNIPQENFCVTLINLSEPRSPYLSGSRIQITDDETLQVRVDNIGPQTLYVYMYNFGSRWNIKNMLHGSSMVLFPLGRKTDKFPPENKYKRTGRMSKRFPMTVPDGKDMCEDEIKVFLTTSHTSFEPLELAIIKANLEDEKARPSAMRGSSSEAEAEDDDEKQLRQPDPEISEQWAMATFTIVTRNKGK